MIKVGIIGATGYTGIELLRLLLAHPKVKVTSLATKSYVGEEIVKLYPHLAGSTSLIGENFNSKKIKKSCDVVFIALPHGHAATIVQPLLEAGVRVIDLGADFRLRDAATYQHWYQQTPAQEALLKQAVYGLPEQGHKEAIQAARLIANPGCYPTAALLATLPALTANIIDKNECLFDAKSGVSGAGRNPQLTSHYCEISENLVAYQIAGQHRHTPEIEQVFSDVTKSPVTIQFTPHVVPIIRGLLVTAYYKLISLLSLDEIHAIYQNYYASQPFIRLSPLGVIPQVKNVRGTNFCDLGIQIDHRTQRLIVISVIDNLIKGAAGQAIQNFNLMHQFPEALGLTDIYATYP